MTDQHCCEKPAKILIVDDKKANLKALAAVIDSLKLNVEIKSALSGNEALGLTLDNDFAMVLLDVQMPGMDGFEVATLMRSDDRLKHIPIIFITAGSKDLSKTMHGYGSGAVDFLYKPFNPYILGSKIRIFVELFFQKQKLQGQIATIEEQKKQVDFLRKKAETASNFKSRFVANMSHEIRTPLGAILGYSEILQNISEDANSKEISKYIQPIVRNGQLLLNLVNSVLDFSKIESGCLDIEVHQFSLVELLEDIKTMFELKASDKGVKFFIEIDQETPDKVNSDSLRLKQILINLVGNALKYTEKGYVKIRVKSRAKDGAGRLVDLFIEDTGTGIDSEFHDHVFSAYGQIEGDVLKAQGTGLGLPIARELAISLGGNLVLEGSKLGVGSTFKLTIDSASQDSGKPLDPDSQTDKKLEESNTTHHQGATLKDRNILLVDDAVDMRRAVEIVLIRNGAEVTVASDGKQALELIAQNNFDAIVMDVQMPVMSGPEAVSHLRNRGEMLPVIALTAHAFDNEYVKCLESGYDDYLTKPVDFGKLILMLATLTDAETSAKASFNRTSTDRRRLGSPYEDDEELLPILQSFLQELDNNLLNIEALIKSGKATDAQKIIHTIRGTAGSLGYYRIAAMILGLENTLKAEKSNEAEIQIKMIRNLYSQTAEYFSRKHPDHLVAIS